MNPWVVVVSTVAAGFVYWQILPRVFPKQMGSSYLRKQLWLKGIDWRKLPAACLDDFVNEALHYAKAASKADPEVHGGRGSFLVEYERMMRVHAFIAAALIQKKTPVEVEELNRKEVESRIQTALMNRGYGHAVVARARAEVGKTIGAEAMRVAILRAGLGPLDMGEHERIAEEVRTGKTWDLQREILRRHGILQGA